jgi:hypothetical protein
MPPRKGRHFTFGLMIAMEPETSHFVRISFAFGAELAAIARAQPKPDVGDINRMMKTLCAGVFALAAIGLLSNISAASAAEMGNGYAAQGPMSASIDVGRIRSVLRLTQEQERYWRPVEAALRDLARHQERAESDGFVHRVSRRVVSIVLNSVAVERLVVAARPLIAKLNDEQKQAAGHLAQEMGLGAVVMAALN